MKPSGHGCVDERSSLIILYWRRSEEAEILVYGEKGNFAFNANFKSGAKTDICSG
jgi:hypothetical protein